MSTHSQKLYWIHIWKLKGLIDKDRSLPPVCKTVAWQLLDHYNLETGKCYPSHQTLAEECNYKLKQVKNATRKLKEKYIFIERRGKTGRANEYQPAFELVFSDPDVVQYCATVSVKTESKKGYKITPQTINQTIYKQQELTDEELKWKVKHNMLGKLDQKQVDKGRLLLAEEKQKKC